MPPEFRYAQFCAIARACEIVSSRWTLLLVRDLAAGPLRFSDLLRGQPGLSTSVLAERLEFLERHGVVEQRVLPPPAASAVYALTETGRALRPVLAEMLRWGLRFMGNTLPDDHVEPRWIPVGLEVVARRGPTPARTIELRIAAEPDPLVVRVAGGPGGTRVLAEPGAADAVLEAAPRDVLLLAAGMLSARDALAAGRIRAQGDLSALDEFAGLFELPVGNPT